MKKRKKKIVRYIDNTLGHRKPKKKTARDRRIVMLTAEVQRLTAKCQERSNECYLLKVQKDAVEAKLAAIRRAYNAFDSEFIRVLRT